MMRDHGTQSSTTTSIPLGETRTFAALHFNQVLIVVIAGWAAFIQLGRV